MSSDIFISFDLLNLPLYTDVYGFYDLRFYFTFRGELTYYYSIRMYVIVVCTEVHGHYLHLFSILIPIFPDTNLYLSIKLMYAEAYGHRLI